MTQGDSNDNGVNAVLNESKVLYILINALFWQKDYKEGSLNPVFAKSKILKILINALLLL